MAKRTKEKKQEKPEQELSPEDLEAVAGGVSLGGQITVDTTLASIVEKKAAPVAIQGAVSALPYKDLLL